ncbi:MAG TPA: zinc-binding dehydrogenase, partial [Blastocatellia bacterium]|nr:zinc-binding dehydrogenase [Blastocatellia bacterium]
MSDLTVRLSKLSPEKQGMLLQRIRQQAGYRGGWCEPEPATETRPFSPADQNYVMRISEIGDLDNLIFEACPRQPPKPGEVEIEIYASSLNFRDVMTALGLYPHASSRDRLLGDCAGKVVAVGDGVQDYRVGDEVLALVSHPYSAFTLVKSKYVAFKPADMSFAEAATIMTVYSTVYYSLYHLARLSRGESVLIHSAAGGVGLAAVQMAQWLGADIIASVGSEQKREYLRSLGVEQIVSSKNPDFDEEVLALTGGKGVDVVLNSLAGDAIIKGLALLKPLGRFIEL